MLTAAMVTVGGASMIPRMTHPRPEPPHQVIAPLGAERRTVLQGAAGLLFAWLTPHAAAAQDEARARPAAGDVLVRVGDATGAPLTPTDVPPGGGPVMAWAMSPETRVVRSASRLNRVLLVRLEPSVLQEATRARAADGVVAYSAICTHTGCEVGTYLAEEQQLYCECHQSKFDPRDQARVTDGPAPRNLPALPLRIVDGRLVVAGPFSTRPGFEQG
jgi:rieske iron-sulfur protein